MTAVVDIPAPLDSLFDQISQEFDQTEAANVIHELKRLYPTKRDSFDPTDLYGALKQLYVLGAISDEGKQKFLELLVKKTSKKDDILKLISGHKEASSPRKDGFVGRDNDVKKILKLVTNTRVPGVNLYGDSGVGKTTLAKEVSKKLELEKKDLFLIDLRGIKDTNTVYFKVLEMFKLTPWDYSKERIYSHLQNLATKTILILDNVEQFLSNVKEVDQKRRLEFLEFIKTIMSTETSKSGNVKVILTSRIQTGDSTLKDMHFTEYELLPLTEKQSRQLMSGRLGDESDDNQEKVLNEIADLCRNTPYLLERAEQLMRQNFSKPSEVLQKLNILKNKGVPERFACIIALFESLPSDQLRKVAVKISLLQGPFSVSTAMRIADLSSDYDAELELEMLAMHKIVAAEDVNGKRKYDFHELFREFVASYLCKEDSVYKNAYEEGESQFVEHFSKIFTQHANNLDKDFVGTYKELEEDKANLELSIDLVTRKETFDLILQSDDVKGTGSVAILFEAFQGIKKRRELFGEWAKIVEKKGNWLSSANLRCWESIQLADMEGTQGACETLKRGKMSLAKAMLILTPEQIKAAKGLCKYCSGQLKYMSSANLIDESSKKEKERLLKQALYDLKLSLAIHRKIYGDHTLTARTLNLIGNCHIERGEPKEALEFYQRAIDMKIRVVGSEKHFDIPSYYNNISQAYEALGNAGTPTGASWSFQSFANLIRSFFSQEKRQHYQKAADYLDKALNLQKELGVNDTNDTATFTRNLANILIVLGEYEKALKHAKKSFEIRKANLGDHPETVRILYLIGIIHEWRKDLEAALQSYEEAFVMEESLPEDNHSVVRKLLCGRLEEMCKKLKKNEKMIEYRPRMEEIRKKSDAYAGKKSEADAGKNTDAGKSTSIIRLDTEGGFYDFSSDYFFLEVPCNAVNAPVEVSYNIDPCRGQPTMAGITTSVNYFLEMSSSMTEELNEPITMTLMHSGPGEEYGFKTTAMVFDQDKDVWEEPPEPGQGSSVCKTDSIRVQISELTILAVVTRLITDRFQVTPKGCVVRSSVCHDVIVEFPEGAVEKTVEGTMKVIPVDTDLWEKEKGYPLPILVLCVDGFEEVTFQKLPTVKLPQPSPEKYSESKICVLCLEDSKTLGGRENQWKDITNEIRIEESEHWIQLRVTHFSWWFVEKWKDISPMTNISSRFKYLLSPPRNVCFAAFKNSEDSLTSFKLGLMCVDNKRREGHSKLNPETGEKMRLEDKACVKIEGHFRQEETQREPIFLRFLGDEVCEKYVYICKRDESDNINGREMLKVSFHAENNQEHRLCLLSFKVKDIPIKGTEDSCDRCLVTTNFDLADEQKRWLVVGICLNKTLLPPLRVFLKQEIEKHYHDLKVKHSIDKQIHGSHLEKDGKYKLSYKSINNNEAKKNNSHLYDYNVNSAEELGKLYLMPYMAKFTGFDDTCDLSAVLGILSSASVFSVNVQKLAKEVKNEVRNPWGHCNFLEWTDTKFTSCCQLMKSLVQALKLPEEDEKRITDEIGDWETKGVGADSFSKFIEFAEFAVQIQRLSEELKRLEANQKEQAEQIAAALHEDLEANQEDEQKAAFLSMKEEVENIAATLQRILKKLKDNKALDKRLTALEEKQDGNDKKIEVLIEKQESYKKRMEDVEQKVKDITPNTDEEPVECFGILIDNFKDLPEDVIPCMMIYLDDDDIQGKENRQWKPEEFLRKIPTKSKDTPRNECLQRLLEFLQQKVPQAMSHIIELLRVGKVVANKPFKENQDLAKKTVEIVSSNLNCCWETLAGHLNVHEDIVSRCKEEYSGDTPEVTSQMLRRWIETSDKSCTLEVVFDALRLCGDKKTGEQLATYTTELIMKNIAQV